MNEPTLDTSALLAFMFEERGADIVGTVLPGAFMSAVNLAEAIAKLCERGLSVEAAARAVEDAGVWIVDLDRDQAVGIGALRSSTRALGLSLGDRACLVLAKRRGSVAMTADRAWTKLEGFDIRLVRGAQTD